MTNSRPIVVSVKDMAALCGLSRQRFAQLVKAGVFPQPLYDITSHRPLYTEELQHVCLEVRRRNFGINGKAVLFYSKRTSTAPTTQKVVKTEKSKVRPEILDGLEALGLTVSATQVAEATKMVFPTGTDNIDQAEIVRAIFIHLKRKNSGVNVSSKVSFTSQ